MSLFVNCVGFVSVHYIVVPHGFHPIFPFDPCQSIPLSRVTRFDPLAGQQL
jgi:hypothetical protein